MFTKKILKREKSLWPYFLKNFYITYLNYFSANEIFPPLNFNLDFDQVFLSFY